eukprot:m.39672 g.39672  ORF g.39672 m.39672 type:complete len:905 (-) comp11299_c0_seq1:29-2743(-)
MIRLGSTVTVRRPRLGVALTAAVLGVLLLLVLLGCLLARLPPPRADALGVSRRHLEDVGDISEKTHPTVTISPSMVPASPPGSSDRSDHSDHSCSVVHLGVLVAGANATRSAVTLIKSILAHRTCALHFHFLVDGRSARVLGELMASWAVSHVEVSLHSLVNHTAEVAWVRTAHASGVYGLSKLLYESVLPPSIPRLIALDTDMVMLGDVRQLWDEFDRFSSEQCVGAVAQQSDWYLGAVSDPRGPSIVWPAVARGINTGVLLLHLDRLRALPWRPLWSALTRSELKHRRYTALADQDVFNLAQVHHPNLFYSLPCTWNVQIHARSNARETCYGGDGGGGGDGSAPRLLHWNSPGKQREPHADAAWFLGEFWKHYTMQGDVVRAAPLAVAACRPHGGPVHTTSGTAAIDTPSLAVAGALALRAGIPLPRVGDPCFAHQLAAARLYRTHLWLHEVALSRARYECTLGPVLGVPGNLLPKERTVVLAKTVGQAEARFQKYLQRSLKQARSLGVDIMPDVLPRPVCARALAGAAAGGRRGAATGGGASASASAPLSLTLTVQLSVDRLPNLGPVLGRFEGPASVAVFLSDADLPGLAATVPTLPTRDTSIHGVFRPSPLTAAQAALAAAQDARGGAGEQAAGQVEELELLNGLGRGSVPVLYPVNYLRNVAVRATETTFVFSTDVDLLPSPHMHSRLLRWLRELRDTAELAHGRVALVVPTFETQSYNHASVGLSKQAMSVAMSDGSQGTLRPFRVAEFPQGHRATDYARWWGATKPYQIEWEPGFEPYLVVPRALSPQFDERYVGFGWNKVSFVRKLHQQGFSFWVAPDAWLVHLPHAPSADLRAFRASPAYQGCLASLGPDHDDAARSANNAGANDQRHHYRQQHGQQQQQDIMEARRALRRGEA